MHSEGYGSCRVCVCVCVRKSHLTSGASVRCENAATYSAGNESQKIVAFLFRYRDRVLPPMMAIHQIGHFSYNMRIVRLFVPYVKLSLLYNFTMIIVGLERSS